MQTFIHISRQNIFSLHNKYNNYRQAYLHGSINIDLNKDWSYSMRKKNRYLTKGSYVNFAFLFVKLLLDDLLVANSVISIVPRSFSFKFSVYHFKKLH